MSGTLQNQLANIESSTKVIEGLDRAVSQARRSRNLLVAQAYISGASWSQIAEAIGCSRQAVGKMIHAVTGEELDNEG